MANVFSASDRFEHKARRSCTGLYTTRRRDQIAKASSEDKCYGGVKKAKHPSAFKQPFLKKAKHPSVFKQPFLYETLIAMAIRGSPMQTLNVAGIHAYIAELYPYFKACPGSLKANIIRTLSSSTCFEKLGEPCQHYWTLTSKAKTCVTKEPTVLGTNYASYSQPTNHSSSPAHSRANVSTTPLAQPAVCTPPTAYSQATVSTYVSKIPNTQPDPPTTAHWDANSKQTCFTHDDLLRHYIHNSPIYPRVPVITLTGQEQPDETEIKIGQVFSLNPQPASTLSRSPAERSPTQIIPYHPCTFRASRGTHNSPTLSSFVSEDKERYEDA